MLAPRREEEGKRLCLYHISLLLTGGNSSNCCTSDQSIAFLFQTHNVLAALKKWRWALQIYFWGQPVQYYSLSIEGAGGPRTRDSVSSLPFCVHLLPGCCKVKLLPVQRPAGAAVLRVLDCSLVASSEMQPLHGDSWPGFSEGRVQSSSAGAAPPFHLCLLLSRSVPSTSSKVCISALGVFFLSP